MRCEVAQAFVAGHKLGSHRLSLSDNCTRRSSMGKRRIVTVLNHLGEVEGSNREDKMQRAQRQVVLSSCARSHLSILNLFRESPVSGLNF